MPVYARSYSYYKRLAQEEIKAMIFGLCIVVTFVVLLTMSFMSGQMVLGTELNANGTVEYLCLGSGCESMADMRWSDK